jgi:hypothetical protein
LQRHHRGGGSFALSCSFLAFLSGFLETTFFLLINYLQRIVTMMKTYARVMLNVLNERRALTNVAFDWIRSARAEGALSTQKTKQRPRKEERQKRQREERCYQMQKEGIRNGTTQLAPEHPKRSSTAKTIRTIRVSSLFIGRIAALMRL